MVWQDKCVLVTGAGGFIGSHLVERLLQEGCQTRALVRYNSAGSQGWLEDLPQDLTNHLEVVTGDVRDAAQMVNVVDGCEVVFHLAALIAIPYSYQAPESYVDTNVRGTLNVLMAARQHGNVRVVHTSTSEVYGTPQSVPITESHMLQAQSPYAASKIGADKVAESFYCSYDLPVTILRPFNTYGPRQSARAVLPTILSQLLAGYSQIKLGALSPRRDLTFVEDTVSGFLMAAADAGVGQTVQLGTGHDISIGELVNLAMRVLDRSAEVICEEARLRPEHSEVDHLLSDPAYAKSLLGWQPTISLEEGLRKTAKWIESHMALYRPDEYAV